MDCAIKLAQMCWKAADIEKDPIRRALFEMAGNCLEDTKCLHGQEALTALPMLNTDVLASRKHRAETPESVLLNLVIETLNPDGE